MSNFDERLFEDRGNIPSEKTGEVMSGITKEKRMVISDLIRVPIKKLSGYFYGGKNDT